MKNNLPVISSRMRKYSLYAFLSCLCLVLPTLSCSREFSILIKNGDTSATTGQKSTPQESSSSSLSSPQIEKLKKFSSEDLLKEARARELEANQQDLSDALLERMEDERIHQPVLRTVKRNSLLRLFSTADLTQALFEQQKAIYGQDNRKEVFLISSDPQLKKSADAVLSLFQASRIIPLPDGKNSKIVRKIYGTEYRLCDAGAFVAQPCSAFCSAVLVAPDIIATAGHCIEAAETKTPPLKDIKFVFGYRMRDDGNPELIINNSEIYTGKEVIGRAFTSAGPDWALIRLDRTVTGHAPVPVRTSSRIPDAEDLYVIGHPCGLPAKFADGAIVRSNSNGDFFVANLDTYGGNSGSPVFNRSTHQVEGILVRRDRFCFPKLLFSKLLSRLISMPKLRLSWRGLRANNPLCSFVAA